MLTSRDDLRARRHTECFELIGGTTNEVQSDLGYSTAPCSCTLFPRSCRHLVRELLAVQTSYSLGPGQRIAVQHSAGLG